MRGFKQLLQFKRTMGFGWWELILFIISNWSTIVELIKKIIDLFTSINGEPGKDERFQVKVARRELKRLADAVGVSTPPDLVMD